ncbi:MAG: hypothetical protein ABSA23_12855 [Anaerolineales bacterium]|jgi:hypothetical protein
MSASISFTRFTLPSGQSAWIPADIELRIPEKTSLDASNLHYLIYLPWHDQYLELVDPAYRDFFQVVLPYLHARSTDVHVTTCLPFIKELSQAESGPVDEQVVQIAFMLHDSGWSQMSELEIAESLGVTGLSLSGEAVQPKARHAVLGQQVAQKVLEAYPFQPPLTASQKNDIYQAILYHDRPQELASAGGIPASLKVVCNTDHLWSFTHPNFWQDTLRKGVSPPAYLENLGQDLDAYFVSEPGRCKARQCLAERALEVQAWKSWTQPKTSHP